MYIPQLYMLSDYISNNVQIFNINELDYVL